jgi:hypothetical protein
MKTVVEGSLLDHLDRFLLDHPDGSLLDRGCTTGVIKRGDAIFASVQVRRLNATLLLGAGRSGVAAWERAGQCRRAAKRRAAR